MKIGVVGAGAWGTALANLLAEKGFKVDLWAYEEEVCDDIAQRRENRLFLPGVALSANLRPSNDLKRVAAKKEILILVVPSHVFRSVVQGLAGELGDETIVVSASKGIENRTHLTMTGILKELLAERFHDSLAVVSGPSFAAEVAREVPTAVTVAAHGSRVGEKVQALFATPFFRVYTSGDLIGAETGGAVKNVMAIAAGISDGLGLGLNTRAALITRGITEIQRLGIRLGAEPKTFSGLAGIGDLILTCTGTLSRNWAVGNRLGQGMKLDEIISGTRTVAEGVRTTKSVYNLSRKLEIEMPIAEHVYRILYEDLDPRQALHTLMMRDLRHEHDGELGL
ncbi:MAG: NAD(P)-dependent glycerol-3-phosphate dehydrogenase [Deltaproteobacteria bacterium]|nr:NAD(P)-dependent glycerol-3-phosphate dehydrogenase [Deltaproteobacteria bacterium]MBW2049202.1 NAD(P)-dependent glycerol-3-phosphate dehydrogenase [Deltaproteobacteria bacterium]MBW2110824.1 NAD(P)-dependent glycerol-3-phosphate dehydrogenase [Deltaproteobacteria bacterium]MBW2354279.1 NAD(P)-dependent glycerol-3-phosphate dehydrogenase [Deltaproteobacteria bacterium]HDZ90744.1 NAD(P)-dependent glycerol-3-phosphate dehydrogenase [Deltaproteobacteria bacterium]